MTNPIASRITAVLTGLALAASIGVASAKAPETVDQLGCQEAFARLKEKLELYQQLGEAYLQTHKTLGDTYMIWGRRLSQPITAIEASSAGTFLLSSAQSNQAAIAQSSEVVKALQEETDLLINRLSGCIRE